MRQTKKRAGTLCFERLGMKKRCEFCKKKIAPQGMLMHVSARHRGMVLAQFRTNPSVILHCLAERAWLPPMQLALPSPNPLTVYSRRPLGMMAAPLPYMRRPKGYQPPENYATPSDLLRFGAARYAWYNS
jgi:hypothetical protein